ncbi:hypothetical protein WN943_005654 [Citrus x changshan-huyou]
MMAKQKNNDSPANVLHSKKWHDLEQCLGERVLKTLLEWLRKKACVIFASCLFIACRERLVHNWVAKEEDVKKLCDNL